MPIIDPDREPDLTPYQRAESWLYMMWMDVYKKCIAMIEQKIIDGTLGGGAGIGAVFWEMTGLLSVSNVPAGPTNVWGADMLITAATATSDVMANFSLGGISFAPAAGTPDVQTGLSVTWADGTQLAASMSLLGEGGTYVNVTLAFRYK